MSKTRIQMEYVWVDGEKVQTLRSKIRILYVDMRRFSDVDSYMGSTPRQVTFSDLERIPTWEFDGTSAGNLGRCKLLPIKLYKNLDGSYIVLCETFNGDIRLSTNYRNILKQTSDKIIKNNLFIKQEYFIANGIKLTGDNYCNARAYGSKIVQELIRYCLDLDITIDDIHQLNIGTWSYKLISTDALSLCDDLWITRFMLHKICNEQKEILVLESYSDRLLKMHVNYKDMILTFNAQDNPYKIFLDLI